MAGVKEKSVAAIPRWVFRIGQQKLRVKDIDEVGATHGTTGMARAGTFNHSGRQDADIVGPGVKDRLIGMIIHKTDAGALSWGLIAAVPGLRAPTPAARWSAPALQSYNNRPNPPNIFVNLPRFYYLCRRYNPTP